MLKRKASTGISLIECLIALAVLSIGMSGVAASLFYGVEKSKHADQVASATQYGRILAEIALGRNYNDSQIAIDPGTGLPSNASGMNDLPGALPRAIDAPPFSATDFLPVAESGAVNPRDYLKNFTRKIQITRRGAKNTPDELLVLMKTTIYWNDKGVQRSVSTSAVLPTSVGAP